MEHVVTGLSVQKNNPNRVNVYLDGEFGFGLSRIVAAWLTVGQVLSDEKIEQLQLDDQYETAYQAALRFVSYRPRSQAEVEQYLTRRIYNPETIEKVVQRMKDLDMVNDQQFVQAWIENRNEFRPRSRRALQVELRQRGVDQAIIEECLEDIDDEILAYRAAQKQAKKLSHLDWPIFRQKMVRFLAQRGFSYETSATVVANIWAEVKHDE